MERIVNTELGVIREPLRAPFGFKGGTLSELCQTAVRLTLDTERAAWVWAYPERALVRPRHILRL